MNPTTMRFAAIMRPTGGASRKNGNANVAPESATATARPRTARRGRSAATTFTAIAARRNARTRATVSLLANSKETRISRNSEGD